MASGSSARAANSGSKTYDFASDDILCSYNDFNDSNQDSSNSISHSDPPATNGSSSLKEYHNNRITRMFPANSYSQPEEYPSQDMITVVEGTIKKYTGNLMRFLEGISSRLSQLELYCYNLDTSIGEMRSDLVRDHGEADSKLKSLEKHLQEVHRSVQILRDKQEFADAQKELAKRQVALKDSSTGANSQYSEERVPTPVSDSKTGENNTADVHNQQLALVPHQIAAPQSLLPTRPVEQPQPMTPPPQAPPQTMIQNQSYYLPTNQLPNPLPQQIQTPHDQYMQSQLIQTVHPYSQFQQQWPQQLSQQPQQYSQQQQLPQQPQPPQQPPSMHTQVRPQSTSVYSQYPQSQPTNTSSESVPLPGIPQPMLSRGDTMPYYHIPGRTVHQQPALPQHVNPSFSPQSGNGYTPSTHHPAPSSASSYVMYNSEGMRAQPAPQQQPLFTSGGYSLQQNTGTNPMIQNTSQSQFVRNHPYNELMEKLVNMGYMSDHVSSVIQRLEESGQAVDFNAVLDRLNSHSSGGSQQGWSR